MKTSTVVISIQKIIFVLLSIAAMGAQSQQLQFCIYNKYGQRQGGCYLDKKGCENVAATYNKSNPSMGFFCQPEKK